MDNGFDALLIVSFGGPERPEDVMPFLENVTRGRGIPAERLQEVAEHYYHFGGRSPINDQNRELIGALEKLFAHEGPRLPLYWGNRNWHPFLTDTVRQMKSDGVRHAAAFITSAFGSYSGCRQYREDIARSVAEAGDGAPEITPLRLFGDHEGFLEPMTERVKEAVGQFERPPHVAFTAHSVPQAMAASSPYVEQLQTAVRTIVTRMNHSDWALVYQSRSGPPSQPWLEPDILDHIRALHSRGVGELVIAPIGFLSDHMEVLYDLDTEAAGLCKELGIRLVRAGTVGAHPQFVRAIRQMLSEPPRSGRADCCPPPVRRPPASR
jgi:ferrochelatase